MKRLMLIILASVVLALLLVAVAVRLGENHMIYFPPRYPEGFLPAAAYSFKFDEVWLTAADGVKINAWYVPQAGSRKVLLMFHGNGENIGQMGQARIPSMLGTGANILAVDYRGYGRSEGTPDEAGVYRDAEAAWRYLIDLRGHRPEEVYIYGQSLGGAVAVELAARHPCGGLIVEDSFTSIRDVARLMFRIPFVAFLAKSRFDSLAAIRTVRCPVFIIHGTEDGLLPFWMGERLYSAANEPKQFWAVQGATHNDVFLVGGNEYVKRFRAFLGE
jgi:uncharacterized protein